jgi:hypothetical protein
MATLWAVAGPAQGAAQQVREVGIEAVATSSDPALAVAGPYGAFRTSGRSRVSAAVGAGLSDGDFAWRGEALVHFLLNPVQGRGWGAYFAGGLAAVGGPVSRGYMVLTLGIEERPGGRSGWVAEAGIGGGLRISAGYRWRRFPPGWPQ